MTIIEAWKLAGAAMPFKVRLVNPPNGNYDGYPETPFYIRGIYNNAGFGRPPVFQLNWSHTLSGTITRGYGIGSEANSWELLEGEYERFLKESVTGKLGESEGMVKELLGKMLEKGLLVSV